MMKQAKQVLLPADPKEALLKLWDRPDKSERRWLFEHELPYFQFYLNLAITHIQGIAHLDESKFDEEAIVKQIMKLDKETRFRLADFLWLSKVDDAKSLFYKDCCPQECAISFPEEKKPCNDEAGNLAEGKDDVKSFFPCCNERCPLRAKDECSNYDARIIVQLYRLRNFLAHYTRPDTTIGALLTDYQFYTFFAGWLFGEAKSKALNGQIKTDKLHKMKLMTQQTEGKDTPREQCQYAFTRKGLVFLICLALYKHEAHEFCQALVDMKLPTKELLAVEQPDEDAQTALRKKKSQREASRELFTYFSMRESYGAVWKDDHNFIYFTDLIEYLNTVPLVSLDYLALRKERELLAEDCAKSEESESNKLWKYSLHGRQKERFLSFLTAYCEDFDIIPSIEFKRQDLRPSIERHRYCFGEDEKRKNFTSDSADSDISRDRQDRHYAISRDCVHFRFVPKEHVGPIHIVELRSAISAEELKTLLLAIEAKLLPNADFIKDYFGAYHRVLERLLNEPDCQAIDRTAYLKDLTIVTGATEQELSETTSYLTKMSPYFTSVITQFLIPKDNIHSQGKLLSDVQKAIKGQIQRDEEFLKFLERNARWRMATEEERKKLPRVDKISDNQLIAKVFDLLNLYLEPGRKFRQLPRAMQHRGTTDREYQHIHELIGKFPLDPQKLWSYLRGENADADRARKELVDVIDALKMREYEISKSGRKSLFSLAQAAVELHKSFCEKKQTLFLGETVSETLLQEGCRLFDVRPGLPLTRDALLTAVLGVERHKWEHAYNYAEGRPWRNRQLEETEHKVSQIPFPNGIVARLCNCPDLQKRMRHLQDYWKVKADGGVEFDFHLFERNFLYPHLKVSLRDYYDTTPLLNAMKTRSVEGTAWEEFLQAEYPKFEELPGRNELDKVMKEIKAVRNQDILLLDIALKYHERYTKSDPIGKLDLKGTIYRYFSWKETKEFGGLKVEFLPNDRRHTVFNQYIAQGVFKEYYGILKGQLEKELATSGISSDKVAKRVKSELATPRELYQILTEIRNLLAKSRPIRVTYFSLFMQLFEKIGDFPKGSGEKGDEDGFTPKDIEHSQKCLDLIVEDEQKQLFSKNDYIFFRELRDEVFHNKQVFLSKETTERANRIFALLGFTVKQETAMPKKSNPSSSSRPHPGNGRKDAKWHKPENKNLPRNRGGHGPNDSSKRDGGSDNFGNIGGLFDNITLKK